MIHVECPQCHQKYKVQDQLAGKHAACQKCGASIAIGQPQAAETVTTSAPPSRASSASIGSPPPRRAAEASAATVQREVEMPAAAAVSAPAVVEKRPWRLPRLAIYLASGAIIALVFALVIYLMGYRGLFPYACMIWGIFGFVLTGLCMLGGDRIAAEPNDTASAASAQRNNVEAAIVAGLFAGVPLLEAMFWGAVREGTPAEGSGRMLALKLLAACIIAPVIFFLWKMVRQMGIFKVVGPAYLALSVLGMPAALLTLGSSSSQAESGQLVDNWDALPVEQRTKHIELFLKDDLKDDYRQACDVFGPENVQMVQVVYPSLTESQFSQIAAAYEAPGRTCRIAQQNNEGIYLIIAPEDDRDAIRRQVKFNRVNMKHGVMRIQPTQQELEWYFQDESASASVAATSAPAIPAESDLPRPVQPVYREACQEAGAEKVQVVSVLLENADKHLPAVQASFEARGRRCRVAGANRYGFHLMVSPIHDREAFYNELAFQRMELKPTGILEIRITADELENRFGVPVAAATQPGEAGPATPTTSAAPKSPASSMTAEMFLAEEVRTDYRKACDTVGAEMVHVVDFAEAPTTEQQEAIRAPFLEAKLNCTAIRTEAGLTLLIYPEANPQAVREKLPFAQITEFDKIRLLKVKFTPEELQHLVAVPAEPEPTTTAATEPVPEPESPEPKPKAKVSREQSQIEFFLDDDAKPIYREACEKHGYENVQVVEVRGIDAEKYVGPISARFKRPKWTCTVADDTFGFVLIISPESDIEVVKKIITFGHVNEFAGILKVNTHRPDLERMFGKPRK